MPYIASNIPPAFRRIEIHAGFAVLSGHTRAHCVVDKCVPAAVAQGCYKLRTGISRNITHILWNIQRRMHFITHLNPVITSDTVVLFLHLHPYRTDSFDCRLISIRIIFCRRNQIYQANHFISFFQCVVSKQLYVEIYLSGAPGTLFCIRFICGKF